ACRRASVTPPSSSAASTSRRVAAQTGASASLPMLMTRNVLPQIALQAAKATQGPASEVGRAWASTVDTLRDDCALGALEQAEDAGGGREVDARVVDRD